MSEKDKLTVEAVLKDLRVIKDLPQAGWIEDTKTKLKFYIRLNKVETSQDYLTLTYHQKMEVWKDWAIVDVEDILEASARLQLVTYEYAKEVKEINQQRLERFTSSLLERIQC